MAQKANQKKLSELISHGVVYEKFMIVEGLACQGKVFTEKRLGDKALDRLKRINNEVRELNLLLKYDPDGDL